jgi:hypothetical protein
MSGKQAEHGYIDTLLVLLIIAGVLVFMTAGFALWAFLGRQDYKDNSDKKSAASAAAAVKSTQDADAVKYGEEAKNPLKTYVGPSAFGAVTLQYPKTWSAYVIEGAGSSPLSAYFHPDIVYYVGDTNNSYALRVEISSSAYSSVVESYKHQVTAGKLTAVPYSLPKVPSVSGMRFEGQIAPKKQGIMIVLPVRNVTLQIWTESADFAHDLDNIVLPNVIFSP